MTLLLSYYQSIFSNILIAGYVLVFNNVKKKKVENQLKTTKSDFKGRQYFEWTTSKVKQSCLLLLVMCITCSILKVSTLNLLKVLKV